MINIWKHVAYICSLLIILNNISMIFARPGQEWDVHNNPCISYDMKAEVCQRCAKQTKSPIVYPMCCNDEEKVYHWCVKYIHYGRDS